MSHIQAKDTTTFDQIYYQFKGEKSVSKGKDVSLRLSGDDLHTKGPTLSKPGKAAAERRAIKKQEAVDTIAQAIDKQLDTHGVGKEILKHLGIVGEHGTGRVTVRDLERIKKEVNEAQKSITTVRGAPYQQMTNVLRNEGLGGLAQKGQKWDDHISAQGASGIIFLKHDGDGPEVCLKFVTELELRSNDVFHEMMSSLESMSDKAFVRSPAYTRVDLPPGDFERRKVEDRLDEMYHRIGERALNTDDPGEKGRLQAKQDKVHEVENGRDMGFKGMLLDANGVAIFEKVENANTLSHATTEQKMRLLGSEEFGVELGRMGVVGCVLGLKDHLSIGNDNGTMGSTNFANLLVDGNDVVQLIDLDLNREPEGGNDGPRKVGRFPNVMTARIGEALDFMVNTVISPEDVTQSLGQTLDLLEEQRASSPIDYWMKGMFGNLVKDVTFFQPNEAAQVLNLSNEQKMFTGLCLLKGQLEGYHFLATNSEAIKDKMIATGEYLNDYPATLDYLAERFSEIDYDKAMKTLNALIEQYRPQEA